MQRFASVGPSSSPAWWAPSAFRPGGAEPAPACRRVTAGELYGVAVHRGRTFAFEHWSGGRGVPRPVTAGLRFWVAMPRAVMQAATVSPAVGPISPASSNRPPESLTRGPLRAPVLSCSAYGNTYMYTLGTCLKSGSRGCRSNTAQRNSRVWGRCRRHGRHLRGGWCAWLMSRMKRGSGFGSSPWRVRSSRRGGSWGCWSTST